MAASILMTYNWDKITDPNTATLVLNCVITPGNIPAFPPLHLSAPNFGTGTQQTAPTIPQGSAFQSTLTAYNAAGQPCVTPAVLLTVPIVPAPPPPPPPPPSGLPASPTGFGVNFVLQT